MRSGGAGPAPQRGEVELDRLEGLGADAGVAFVEPDGAVGVGVDLERPPSARSRSRGLRRCTVARVHRRAFTLILLAGCDGVFGLRQLPTDGAVVADGAVAAGPRLIQATKATMATPLPLTVAVDRAVVGDRILVDVGAYGCGHVFVTDDGVNDYAPSVDDLTGGTLTPGVGRAGLYLASAVVVAPTTSVTIATDGNLECELSIAALVYRGLGDQAAAGPVVLQDTPQPTLTTDAIPQLGAGPTLFLASITHDQSGAASVGTGWEPIIAPSTDHATVPMLVAAHVGEPPAPTLTATFPTATNAAIEVAAFR